MWGVNPRSLGLCWVGVGFRMYLQELGPKEQDPLAGNTHLSRCIWGPGSGDHKGLV